MIIELALPMPEVVLGKRNLGSIRNQTRPLTIKSARVDAETERKIRMEVEGLLSNNFNWLNAAKSYTDELPCDKLTEIAALSGVRSIRLSGEKSTNQ